jgi:hypothetical protein
MDQPDDLDEYLRGDSVLSQQYRRESSPAPPHLLDRRVLRMSREAQGTARRLTPCLEPLAFAACVLLSVALVLALVFGPQAAKRMDDTPRVVRVAARAVVPQNVSPGRKAQFYSGDLRRVRTPSAWLADIAALRRAGRGDEADAEYRRFRTAYPAYTAAGGADQSSGLVIRP